jgi:hypothetical protein
MKFISKFKLGFSLHGKNLVMPIHGLLLILMTAFFMD